MANECNHRSNPIMLIASGELTWCADCGALHLHGEWQLPHHAHAQHDTERPPAMATDPGELATSSEWDPWDDSGKQRQRHPADPEMGR